MTIVTMCMDDYAKCLAFTAPSWRRNVPDDTKFLVFHDDNGAPDLGPTAQYVAWKASLLPMLRHFRFALKIAALSHAFNDLGTGLGDDRNVIWLDADCYAVGPISPIFDVLGNAHFGAARLVRRVYLNKTSVNQPVRYGHRMGNSGVIPFVRHTDFDVASFFTLWQASSEEMRIREQEQRLWEQRAFSDIARDSFDGLLPFRCAILSEYQWNCEHDDLPTWYGIIAKYHPQILHFKSRRWEQQRVINKALELARRTS